MEIKEFKGEYLFLSNFYECPVTMGSDKFGSSEAAYQACKAAKYEDYVKFKELNPEDAKKLGQTIEIVENWDKIKDQVMRDVVYQKFSQNIDLKQKLIDTNPNYLYEGNTWGDKYWGVDINDPNMSGENRLGKILMEIRTGWLENEPTDNLL